MIFYTHIQKTGGTSITEIVKRQENIRIWRRRFTPSNPDFITGHFPYGVHEDWGTIGDYSYATFLRNPIDRWKSQFYHALQKNINVKDYNFNAVHGFLERVCGKELSNHDYKNLTCEDITKFLELCCKNKINDNIMCKQLSGFENLRNVCKFPSNQDCSQDFGFSQVYGWSGRFKDYSDDGMEKLCKRALYNLVENYDFVGLCENSSEDQERFCDYYNFVFPGDAPYRKESSLRFNEEEWFGSSVNMQLLVKLNKWDNNLYTRYKEFIKERTMVVA